MAAKNVDIRINTTADTKGAKAAQAAMDALQKETEQANHSFDEFNETTAEGAAKLAEVARKAKEAAEAQASTAKHLAQQEKDVLALRQKNNQAINTQTTSTRNLGTTAGALGLQLQDVAVQAQSGTQAVTILAQQGTQILSIFGPQGAIAGALLAVGAVAGKIFYDMAKAAAVTGEAMEDMSDKLKEAFGAQAKKMIDEFNASIELQASKAQMLSDAELQLYEIRNLRQETDAKLIKSQLALDEAAIKYLATTGQLVDEEEALLAVRQKAAAAESQALIDASLAQVENEQKKLELINNSKQSVELDVIRAQRQLAELEKQQSELQQLANISGQSDRGLVKIGAEKEGFQSLKTQALEGQLDGLRKQIENVYKVIEGAPQRINEITVAAQAQSVAVNVALEQSQAEIERIQTEFDLTSKAQSLNQAAQSITQDAAAITKEIATIEAITPVQQEAKAAIQQAAADGKITAEEQVAIGRNLSVLLAGMKTGQTESINTVRQLIELNNDMAIKMNAMNKEINGLRERVKAIPIR